LIDKYLNLMVAGVLDEEEESVSLLPKSCDVVEL